RQLGEESPGAGRWVLNQARLSNLELEFDTAAAAVFPRALAPVHLQLLGRLDGDPGASLADRDAGRVPADLHRRGHCPALRVDSRDGAGHVVRRPHRPLAHGDADWAVA